jgi:hypothetical protein
LSGSAYLLLVPQDHNPGLIFRQKLYILPFVFLLALATALLRQKRLLSALLSAGCGLLLLLPLTGLWNSGASDQYILSGTIPWSDAFIHHQNTLRFLFGGTMGQSSAIRPLSLTFYSAILRLSQNNFLLVYALTAMAMAAAIVLTLPVIERRFGPLVSAFFHTNAFFFIRRLTGTFMTEPVAFALATLSALFFIKGIFEKHNGSVALGFLTLSLALNVRPGAMFVLAFGGLWYFFGFAKGNPHRLVWSLAMLVTMLIGFGLSAYNSAFVAEPGKPLTNDQAALYIYGICSGGEDTYYSMVQPELTAYFGSENLWSGVLKLCRQKLAEQPENSSRALKRIIEGVVNDPERGAFSWFDGGNPHLVQGVQYGVMLLWVIGFFVIFKRRAEPFNAFLLAMIAGIFLFQFVAPAYNYYRMRFDAPTYWVSGLVAGIGLCSVFKLLFPRAAWFRTFISPIQNKESSNRYRCSMTIVSMFILCWLVAPPAIKAMPFPITDKIKRDCPADEIALRTWVSPGNYVSLHYYDLQQPHVPDFHLLYVRPGMHDTSTRGMFAFTDSIDEPTTIIKGLDLDTFEEILLFAPLDMVSGTLSGEVSFCARLIDPPIYHNYRFGIVSSAQ